jgi:hypothetical protein
MSKEMLDTDEIKSIISKATLVDKTNSVTVILDNDSPSI